MGDIADWQIDQMYDVECQKLNEIDYILEGNNDDQLKELVKEAGFYDSKYTNLVNNILNFKGDLSQKQRYALAAYYVYSPDDYVESENYDE